METGCMTRSGVWSEKESTMEDLKLYEVWYEPYACLGECDYTTGLFRNAEDARRFGRVLGHVTDVIEITE